MTLGFLIFLICTLGLFTLPMMPALQEFLRPTDISPIKIVQDHDNNVMHFASGFKNYLTEHYPFFFKPESELTDQQTMDKEQMVRKDLYKEMDGDHLPMLNEEEAKTKKVRSMLLSKKELHLADEMQYSREVYSEGAIRTGKDNQVRALYGSNVMVDERSSILRWVHGIHAIIAKSGSALYGRATAGDSIVLQEGANFERLHAPRIIFGDESALPFHPEVQMESLTEITEFKHVKNHYANFWNIRGNVEIPPHSYVNGNIIASGLVIIGEGSVINGSVKGNRGVCLEPYVRIAGSVVSATDIEIEKNTQITGPIIAENAVLIKSGNVIGTATALTTINAPIIEVATGTVAYGSVWASHEGKVVADV